MEAVKLFNQELSSLYEIKPPISKAKMTAITKGAIRAIKYYKHVVQSVEKFIQKCRPEYKIPGLYVIDSIVRQSRHQFGAAKDVFAPRFAKNVQITFFHLYKCPEEEKSRVIRVLNLWQKNEVFTADVIQPLFDLANPNSDLHRQVDEHIKRGGDKATSGSSKAGSIQVVSGSNMASDNDLDSGDQQVLATLQQFLKNHVPQSGNEVKFNKKLLDFDYSDDEEGQNDLSEPTPQMIEALAAILSNDRLLSKLKAMGEITQHHIQQLQQLLPQFHQLQGGSQMWGHGQSSTTDSWASFQQQSLMQQPMMNAQNEAEDDIQIVDDRGGRRGRSRSPRDRKRTRSHRSRSRSRDRSGRSRRRSRSRERDSDREKRREREKKGLPPLKKGYLSVCSTTLWVGHLSKLVADEDLSDLFGEYGVVESINLIPPRGCAFVHMNRRMDAYKALKELHKHKLQGKQITIAWAPGKGMKDKQWKDYWDVELGVSYIPIDKLDPQVDLVALEDGGTFDDETMPEWMKNMRGAHSNQPAVMPAYMNAAAATEVTSALGIPLQAAPVVDPMMLQQAPPPFGIPPGLPPPGAILGPGPPVLLPGLIHQQRFHSFPPPSFDASQPPPGLRMPFPPPGLTTTVPNVEGQGDVEMEIEDQDEGHLNRRNSRGSRWANNSNEEDVQARLRNLASEGLDSNNGPRSLLDLPPVEGPPQDRDNNPFTDGIIGPGGMRPRFGPRGGPFEEPFNNGPAPPFGARNNGGPRGFNDAFNDGPPFGGNRGGRGAGWRGGGRGGRGFRDGPPGGFWMEEGPGPGNGPPPFVDRDGWDQPPWNGGRGGGRGRGGPRGGGHDFRRNDRGGGFGGQNFEGGGFNDRFGNNDRGGFGRGGRDRDRQNERQHESHHESHSDRPPAKRERKSRWGGEAEKIEDSEPFLSAHEDSQPKSEDTNMPDAFGHNDDSVGAPPDESRLGQSDHQEQPQESFEAPSEESRNEATEVDRNIEVPALNEQIHDELLTYTEQPRFSDQEQQHEERDEEPPVHEQESQHQAYERDVEQQAHEREEHQMVHDQEDHRDLCPTEEQPPQPYHEQPESRSELHESHNNHIEQQYQQQHEPPLEESTLPTQFQEVQPPRQLAEEPSNYESPVNHSEKLDQPIVQQEFSETINEEPQNGAVPDQ